MLWMSYCLPPHVMGLLTAAETVLLLKNGQNSTSLISNFTREKTASRCIRERLSAVLCLYFEQCEFSVLLLRLQYNGLEQHV